jgi:two-component system alkaline phosphatase synthesis response regulator PhoP
MEGDTVLTVGTLELRPRERLVTIDGRGLALSAREVELLAELLRRRGSVISRAELYEAAWGAPLRADDRSVDVYVHKLRAKLARVAPGWSFIHTHFGVGYRLSPERSQPFHESVTPGQQAVA